MTGAASVLIAALAVHADATEFSNAVYNVVCLAQQVSCTREKYERLWKDELKWSAEDRIQLERWQAIVRAAEARAPAPSDAPLLANYQSFYPPLRQRTAIISAAVDARSAAAFQSRAVRLMPRDDALALVRVLRHFEARLAPWWRRVGRGRVAGLRALDREFTPPVRKLLGQIATFVQADAGINDVYMHVVPSPDVTNDDASGTVVRNHFFMELVPSGSGDAAATQAAKMIAGVAIHELTHALYDSAPVATHLAVMRQFVAATDRGGPSMYTFLNEAIASAVNGLAVDLSGDTDSDDLGEYRHPWIPRMARAATAPLKRALSDGRTMVDGFVGDYLRSAREILGEAADSLAFRFSATAVLGADSVRAAVSAFRETVAPTNVTDSRANWQRIAELNAAFLITYDDIGEFAGRIPDLAGLQMHRGFAFVMPHNTRSSVLVLAGRDAAAISDVIKQLQTSKPMPEQGLIQAID